jgi:regulator of protease activity HflC (stomatin/prohibitin superfamily)
MMFIIHCCIPIRKKEDEMSEIPNTSSKSSQPEEFLENLIKEEEKSNEPEATSRWRWKAFIKSIFIMLVIGILISNAYYINDETQRAVETRLGKLIRITGPGIQFKLPFIENYQQYQIDMQIIAYKSVSTASSDNYALYGKIILEYRLPEDQLEYIHRNVPNKNFYQYLEDIKTRTLKYWENQENFSRYLKDIKNSILEYLEPNNKAYFDHYLKNIVTSTFKNKMGTIAMDKVPNEKKKRKKLEKQILDQIEEKARNLLKIEIHSFRIPYYGWSQEFLLRIQKDEDNSVTFEAAEWAKNRTQEIADQEEKKASQNIDDADNEAQMKKVEAEANAKLKEIKAKSEAKAKLTTAEAEAYTIRKKGEAQAAALKAQARSLAKNPHFIESEKIKRWDGKLPRYFLNQGISPFMSPISKETLPMQSPRLDGEPK